MNAWVFTIILCLPDGYCMQGVSKAPAADKAACLVAARTTARDALASFMEGITKATDDSPPPVTVITACKAKEST